MEIIEKPLSLDYSATFVLAAGNYIMEMNIWIGSAAGQLLGEEGE